jgi:high-affinity nickel-transport protein
MKRKTIGIYAFLIAFNIAAWVWAIVAFQHYPVLLGTALLAYTFGLRHAFDVDHIAAIDTVTRKLMHQNTCPVTVGFYFAIGHSLIMFIGTFVIMATWNATTGGVTSHEAVAGGFIDGIKLPVLSTFVSASFLLLMAIINLTIARSTYRTFKRVRNGGAYLEEDLDMLLNKRGFLSRIFRPLFRLVNKSWHMLLIGFLFGLGFDTATEIALLGIAGAEAAKGASVWVILVFPTLFAAGMSLMDTTDSVLMSGAYGWAFRKPIRKLYYNMTITTLSALVALVIGGIETAGLISEKYHLKGALWDELSVLNGHWGTIGFGIVAIFIVCWLVSTIVYRAKRYDELAPDSPMG